jgi:hypothetical protein
VNQPLGQAVARCWSILPQEIQHKVFEAAVMSEGEVIRQVLAVYLHASTIVQLLPAIERFAGAR